MAETRSFCESLSIYTAGVEAELIHPALIWDEETAILVDTGYAGQLKLFRQATEALGVAFERVAHIVLTHRDGDHILGLPAMVACPRARVRSRPRWPCWPMPGRPVARQAGWSFKPLSRRPVTGVSERPDQPSRGFNAGNARTQSRER